MAKKTASARPACDPSRFVFEEAPGHSVGHASSTKSIRFETSFSEPSRTEPLPLECDQPKRVSSRSRTSTESLVSARTIGLIVAWTVFVVILALCASHSPFDVTNLGKIQVPGRAFVLSRIRATPSDVPQSQNQNLPSTCSIQDIETALQASIRKALRGPVLLRDFALRADGGKILPSLTTGTAVYTGQSAPDQHALGPDVVIDDQTGIGRCWSTVVPSQIGISTPALIHPTNITIDHIPRELAADIGCAPRRMVLWGVVDGKPNHTRYKSLIAARGRRTPTAPSLTSGHVFLNLASFEYDIGADFHIQTFAVSQDVVDSRMDFGVFVLEIMDDWGAQNVCLYRVRIHGTPARLDSK